MKDGNDRSRRSARDEARARRREERRRRRERHYGPVPPEAPVPPVAPVPPAAPVSPVGDFRHPRHSRRDRKARKRAMTPEERAYRDARRLANQKMSVAIHGLVFALVLLALAIVTRSVRVPLIVGGFWGIGFGTHYFVAIVAPRLRRRWIEDEVGSQIQQGVSEQRRTVQNEHVRSLEDLSASIAHEIRNPVAAAKSLVQQMGEDPISNDNIEYAQVALNELDRVERSISHLLKYARDEELRLDRLNMSEVVHSAVDTFRERQRNSPVDLEVQVHAPGVIRGDPEKLRRIVINLIGNALDAVEEPGVELPTVEISCGENLAGTQVWLRVRDNGPGIDEETLRKIFSPFYTTKETGTGLGLALSKKVVEAHGGTLEAESRPEGGADFILTLPKLGDAQ